MRPAAIRHGAQVGRCAAWLAVAALVFQSFLPLLHQPPAIPGGNGALAGLILLCAPGGYRAVDLSRSADPAAPSKLPKPRPRARVCPICLAAQIAATALATPSFALAPPAATPTRGPPPPVASARDDRHRSPHPPRAPPVVS